MMRRLAMLSWCWLAAVAWAGPDHYAVLGVPRNAGPRRLDEALQEQMRKHPGGLPQEIRDAYGTLADPERRRRFDAELARQEGPRRFRQWRQELLAQLRADYELDRPEPERVRAGFLRMLEEHRVSAWSRFFPEGDRTPERERPGIFWNGYREQLWEPLPHVVDLAAKEVERFLAADPTADEARRFAELVDLRTYLWAGANDRVRASRVPEEAEFRAGRAAQRCRGWALERGKPESLDAFVALLASWWWELLDSDARAPGVAESVGEWIVRAAARFQTTPEAVWKRFVETVAPNDGLVSHLASVAPGLAATLPAAALLDTIQTDVLRFANATDRQALARAARPFAPAVRRLAEADAVVARELGRARSWSAQFWRSPAARCLRALAREAAK